jgi:3-isopropylmalate/(R)-2-methylmalate dehydratase small subunit
MAKEKFDIIQSTCIPIQIDNCNTDLIIPARYLASTTRDPKFFGDASCTTSVSMLRVILWLTL